MTGLVTRTHSKGDADSTAVYSPCDSYRYSLTRVWEPEARGLLYIMLNPSKATEIQNDPTVERCERRARALGYGGFRVTNIFAWRETDPKALRAAAHPVGPDNDAAIAEGLAWADTVIAGWGAHGEHMGRGRAVADLLCRASRDIHHLGLTRAGHPRHPLYIAYAQAPVRWAFEPR
ncbi:hypothetical protein LA6_004817 [Marinibacterium anthonyi]|nr:hypothetical protein LA6_004817 [Marinibacterium anthonyi]